jgi:hypothetical protein
LPGASEGSQYCTSHSLDPIAEDRSNSFSSPQNNSSSRQTELQLQQQQQQQQHLYDVTASWEQDTVAASYQGYFSDHHAAAGCSYQGSYSSCHTQQDPLCNQPEAAFASDEALLLVEQEIMQLVAMRQRLFNAAAAAPLGSQLSAVCHAALRMHTETLLVALETREALQQQQQQDEALAAAEEEALMWQQHSAALAAAAAAAGAQQQRQAEMAWYHRAEHGSPATYRTPVQQQQQAWVGQQSSSWGRQCQGYAAGAVQCQRPTGMQPKAVAVDAAAAHAEQTPESQPQLMQLLPMGNAA